MEVLRAGDIGPVNITVTIPGGITDCFSLAFAFALIVVTAVYVKHTRDMVNEMKRRRAADTADRRREKSDRAASARLDVIRQVSDEMARRGASAVEPGSLSIVHATLRGEGPLIEDDELRGRVAACAEVVFVGSFSNEQMATDRLSAGRVARGVHAMLRATRAALQAYLAELSPQEDCQWPYGRESMSMAVVIICRTSRTPPPGFGALDRRCSRGIRRELETEDVVMTSQPSRHFRGSARSFHHRAAA